MWSDPVVYFATAAQNNNTTSKVEQGTKLVANFQMSEQGELYSRRDVDGNLHPDVICENIFFLFCALPLNYCSCELINWCTVLKKVVLPFCSFQWGDFPYDFFLQGEPQISCHDHFNRPPPPLCATSPCTTTCHRQWRVQQGWAVSKKC